MSNPTPHCAACKMETTTLYQLTWPDGQIANIPPLPSGPLCFRCAGEIQETLPRFRTIAGEFTGGHDATIE